MSAKNKKTAPLVISDEQNEVKIYTVKGRAGSHYQLSYYRAGERQRRTFADLNEAKREARMQLGLLAGERIQARNLTPMEMENRAAGCLQVFVNCALVGTGANKLAATS